MSRSYDAAAIRNKLRQQMSGKFVDPDEFRPPKAESLTEALKFRYYILPPIMAGDKIKGGVAKSDQNMDQFFVSHGNHWINNKPHPCPRVYDGSPCKICQTGFDLLKHVKDNEEEKKAILRQWMPNISYMVNIYFTKSNMNPENLRGQVKFFNAPRTLFDIWSSTLMKDTPGDPEDPEAYGVFFDENAAFLFQMEVIKFGRNNNYKGSFFVPNNGKPSPMAENSDELEKLLRKRINLFEKVQVPNSDEICKLAERMIEGDDGDDDGGFNQDENEKPSSKKPSQTVEKSMKQTKPSKTTVVEDDDTDIVDVLNDEAPIEKPAKTTKTETKAEKPKAEKPKPKPEPELEPESDDDDSSEIDDLLSQLEDDDD